MHANKEMGKLVLDNKANQIFVANSEEEAIQKARKFYGFEEVAILKHDDMSLFFRVPNQGSPAIEPVPEEYKDKRLVYPRPCPR